MFSKIPTYKELKNQITKLKSKQPQEDLFNKMSQNFILIELIYDKKGKVIDLCYLEVNPAFEKLVGKKKEELINKRAKDVFETLNEYWLTLYEKVDRTGKPLTYSNHSGEMNRYYTIQAWKLKKGVIASTFIDITEQKLAEDTLKKTKDNEYKMLFDSTTEMFQVIELIYNQSAKPIDYYYREVNPAFEKFTRKTRKQLINKRVNNIFSIVEDYWLEKYHEVLTHGKPISFEEYGEEFDQYYKATCWKVDKKRVAIIFTDVTKQKRKEKELEKATIKIETQNKELQKLNKTDFVLGEDSFSLYFNYLPSPMAVYKLDANGSLIFMKVNIYMTTLLGLNPDDMIGKSFIEIFPKKKNTEAHELLISVAKGKFKSQKFIDLYKDKNLSTWSEVTIFNLGKNKVGAVSFDISKQKNAEVALDKSDHQYKMLFDSMTEMVKTIEVIYDSKNKPIDFYVHEVNQACLNFLGKTKEQVLNKKASSFIDTIEDYWLNEFANVDKTGVPSTFENYGVEFDKYYSVFAWKISKNKVIIIFTDITEKRRIEKYKVEVKLKLDKIASESKGTEKLANIGSWMFNTLTEKAVWSDEMFNIWGFDIEKGTPDYDTIMKQIHRNDFELYSKYVMEAINFSTPYAIEFRIHTQNGEIKTIKAVCEAVTDPINGVISLQGINQDVTKQKLFEKELIQHERLKAIGEMSSSIAHDFNNSLQVMMGNLELVKLQNDISSKSLNRLNSIGSIITDVATRVNALQQFGDTEHDVREAELMNLNIIIDESINQSRSLWKGNAEKAGLQINVITGFNVIPEINFTIGELKSAIYNIIKNSVEAMPKGGNIIIKTGIKPEGVFARFTDTGIGMTEETKLKLFQPFYSTKEVKMGRGLGMSGVYRILKKHKAEITLMSSEIDKGTTFEITFPIGLQGLVKENTKKEPILKDKETFRILWVDDDNTIGEIASEGLQFIGHTCDYVNSGKKALASLNTKNYDFVFTDIGMPNMNGWELADRIRRKFGSNIKIVIVTGWSISEKTKSEHAVNFILQKPFVLEELEGVLNSL
jgi:signal transduction histidine kinase/CheY-like chemotaxis protein